ncbi:TonB-dependent receptor [Pedobacter cryoconitis]|uniref:Iron complex outermembrane receptor protein n=1 Tax=Pedobacter cryoconitis TaxID=188932 RepID=A0A7X0MJP8_9SPHI|nr:TonB-dependent receptor [Pedobacter cryoconitis]MBB6501707.1 iron complex outermembrane receptor protein [Pedobacter cryoconitis]
MKIRLRILHLICLFCLFGTVAQAQQGYTIRGKILTKDGKPADNVSLTLVGKGHGTQTDNEGEYTITNVKPGDYTLRVTAVGLIPLEKKISLTKKETILPDFILSENLAQLQEVTISVGRTNKFAAKKSKSVAKLPLKNLENPQVYTTITKDLIVEQITTSVGDVLKNTPGLTKILSTSGRSGDGGAYYTMRGFPTQITMIDGIAGRTNADFDPANIEAIEVIKGPSGTLYGGALTSFGGLINLVTKKPVDTLGGEIAYTTGSFGLNRISTDLYGPVNKNKNLLFRLNAAYQNQNSFQDAGFRKSTFIAPVVEYRVNERLKVNIGAEFYNYEGTSPTVIFLNRTRQFTAHNPNELNYDWNRSYTSNDLSIKAPSTNIHAEVNYKISDQWTSKTNYSQNNRKTDGFYQYEFIRNLPGDGYVQRSVQLQNANATSINLQQNFTGDFKIGKLRNRMVIGLDYLNQTALTNNSPIVVMDTVSGLKDVFSPGYGSLSRTSAEKKIGASTAARIRTYNASNVYSAYVSDVLNVTDNLLAMMSLRVDRFETKGTINQVTNMQVANTKNSQTALSPKFGLVYNVIQDQVSIFGNYMNSFANVAPVGVQQGDIPGTFKPMQANQFEGGVKLDVFQHKLSFTASYYNIKVKNMLRDGTVTINNKAYDVQLQDGTQLSKGVEFELIANPVAGLNIIAGYSHNDSKWTKSAPEVEGRRPASAGPAELANAWISYTLQQGDLKGLGLGFGGNYAGKQMTSNSQVTGVFTLPSYTVLNATAFYNTKWYRVGLKFDNLTDQLYFAGQGVITAQMPRNFAANLTLRF